MKKIVFSFCCELEMKEISELPSGSVVKRRSAKSEDMWFESS